VKSEGRDFPLQWIIKFRTVSFNKRNEAQHNFFYWYCERAIPCISNDWKRLKTRSDKLLTEATSVCDEAICMYWLLKYHGIWADQALERKDEDQNDEDDDELEKYLLGNEENDEDEEELEGDEDELPNKDDTDKSLLKDHKEKDKKVFDALKDTFESFSGTTHHTRIDSDHGTFLFSKVMGLTQSLREHHNNKMAETAFLNHSKAKLKASSRDSGEVKEARRKQRNAKKVYKAESIDLSLIVSLP
jgi:hypothetical protein